jgi:hypothetical protein
MTGRYGEETLAAVSAAAKESINGAIWRVQDAY